MSAASAIAPIRRASAPTTIPLIMSSPPLRDLRAIVGRIGPARKRGGRALRPEGPLASSRGSGSRIRPSSPVGGPDIVPDPGHKRHVVVAPAQVVVETEHQALENLTIGSYPSPARAR